MKTSPDYCSNMFAHIDGKYPFMFSDVTDDWRALFDFDLPIYRIVAYQHAAGNYWGWWDNQKQAVTCIHWNKKEIDKALPGGLNANTNAGTGQLIPLVLKKVGMIDKSSGELTVNLDSPWYASLREDGRLDHFCKHWKSVLAYNCQRPVVRVVPMLDDAGDYYGRYDNESEELALIGSPRQYIEICLPYGIEAEIKYGGGGCTVFRCRLRARSTIKPER